MNLAKAMFRSVYRSPDSPTQDDYLTVEWAIQEFWAREILHRLPSFVAVHQALTERKCTQRKPFLWNDLDNSAYLFRSQHKEYQSFVIESQGLRYYYYLKLGKWRRTIHARRKKDSLRFGDCRDEGFLFSLDCLSDGRRGCINHKADHAHAKWSETYYALWYVLCAHEAIKEADGGTDGTRGDSVL